MPLWYHYLGRTMPRTALQREPVVRRRRPLTIRVFPIIFVGASALAEAATGDVSVTPSTTITNDIMICAVSSASFQTHGFPEGWTVVSQGFNTSALGFSVAWKRASGAESAFTITNAGVGVIIAGVSVFRGSPAGNVIDVYSKRDNGATSTCTADGITTTAVEDMVIFTCHALTSAGTSAEVATDPPTFVEGFDFASSLGAVSVTLSYGEKSATGGTGAATATLSSSSISTGILLGLRSVAVVSSSKFSRKFGYIKAGSRSGVV